MLQAIQLIINFLPYLYKPRCKEKCLYFKNNASKAFSTQFTLQFNSKLIIQNSKEVQLNSLEPIEQFELIEPIEPIELIETIKHIEQQFKPFKPFKQSIEPIEQH